MIDLANFRLWLLDTTQYSERTVSNIVLRFKRADGFVAWHNEPIYQFELEQNDLFKGLSSTVRSQIKKAVKLYSEYESHRTLPVRSDQNGRLNVLSLFANIGVAEAYLESIGFDVVVVASYSRHHNLPKGDKSARPRFHVFFPIPKVTDGEEYAAMKRKIADQLHLRK